MCIVTATLTLCVYRSQELFQFSFTIHNVSSLHLRVTCKVNQGQFLFLSDSANSYFIFAWRSSLLAGLAESGGTTELIESIDPNFNRKCSFLIRKFNLESDASISPGTRTEVSMLDWEGVDTSCRGCYLIP